MADLGNISKIQLANGDVAHFQDLVSGYVNTAGTGLTKSGSTLNHSNSISAQTTAKLFPIKFDAQGHITGIETEVTSLPASDVYAWAKAASKPSYAFSEIGSKPTTISGYGITDAYTKTEIDGKISGVLHYKGTKATVGDLPSSGMVTGDVWHITANGSEYAYDGSTWQELGTAVDLSGYLPLTGGTLTGPVTFGSAVSIDEATVGDLIVNGAASFTNNLQVNTINGVAVGSNPKFTDNNTTYSAGTGLSLNNTTFSVKLGYTTSGNNRAIQADSNGNLYVTQKDNNTTYTFANGTNGFTVTPSGGTAQTVTVTPSIANNITGSGTSGYIAKFNGGNTITNGPAFGSATTTYLRNDGTWATPSDTNTHRPIQMNGTEILGNNTTALNLKAGSNVSLSNSSGTVTIAATDTTYSRQTPASGGTTLSLVNTGDMYTWNNKSSATNWLNGSQTGSVRTSGSAAESTTYTIGAYSVAEGGNTKASGTHSHAEGISTNASGDYSHAEGSSSTASGNRSHAEGYQTRAVGMSSHAEGENTEAIGPASHTQGLGTQALSSCQMAVGTYNETDAHSNYAFIIGNGTANDARSNALTVDWDGNVDISGQATDSTGNVLTPSVELTQAEYDELSDAEKNNGTLYFITDSSFDPQYTVINDSVSIGTISSYGGSTAPYGWLICDGSAVSRTTYHDLYQVIGTTYGPGDGSTTFNLPGLESIEPYTTGNSIIKALNVIPTTQIRQIDPQGLVLDTFYPIGSYYETSDASFNPNTTWGGIWILTEGGLLNGPPQVMRREYQPTADITTTSSIDIISFSFTSKTGKIWVYGAATVQTSRYTSSIRLMVNDTNIGSHNSNIQSFTRLTAISQCEIPINTPVTISLRMTSQDSGTTATCKGYTSSQLFVSDVPVITGYSWHRIA